MASSITTELQADRQRDRQTDRQTDKCDSSFFVTAHFLLNK